jgi:hypothetical protein
VRTSEPRASWSALVRAAHLAVGGYIVVADAPYLNRRSLLEAKVRVSGNKSAAAARSSPMEWRAV